MRWVLVRSPIPSVVVDALRWLVKFHTGVPVRMASGFSIYEKYAY